MYVYEQRGDTVQAPYEYVQVLYDGAVRAVVRYECTASASASRLNLEAVSAFVQLGALGGLALANGGSVVDYGRSLLVAVDRIADRMLALEVVGKLRARAWGVTATSRASSRIAIY